MTQKRYGVLNYNVLRNMLLNMFVTFLDMRSLRHVMVLSADNKSC